MACDPATLVANAVCIDCAIPKGYRNAVVIWLLCQIASKPIVPCVTPPSPQIASATRFGNAAVVQWTQAVNPGYGFVLYYGTTSGGPYPTVVVISDPTARNWGGGPFSATTLFFVITAKNLANDCESPFSNQVPLTFP